jgi:folate-dependent phosphoribosylglycinamide formyltransferase PurN
MLAGEGEPTNIVANELRKRFGDFPLIIESSESGWTILRKRGRRLGYWSAAGQALFAPVAGLLHSRSRARIEAILKASGLDAAPVHSGVIRLDSVNSDECIARLKALAPDLIVIQGTRILSRRLLESAGCGFLNMHAGITPGFRGCHGAYWALATGRPDLAGVTIHWVDPGIDTGKVLKQARISPAPADNFATYPYLQLAAGVPLLTQSIVEFFAGGLVESLLPGHDGVNSRLYHHPTLWSYAIARLHGVR